MKLILLLFALYLLRRFLVFTLQPDLLGKSYVRCDGGGKA
jgi:hypothetical protein